MTVLTSQIEAAASQVNSSDYYIWDEPEKFLSTLGDFVLHNEPHPLDAVAPWYSLDYTYLMEPGEAVLPRPPIK